ncbi:MAG: MBG domain-containing protein [Terracidiphilus sp.]
MSVPTGTTEGALEGPSSGVAKYVAAYGQFGFISKLNLSTSQFQYSTYVEGQGTSVTGLAVDSSGNAYLTGTAPAPSAGVNGGFQLTPDSLPVPANQGNSPFLVKLDPMATVLNYATLLGGTNSDGATAVAVDASGNVYLTGFADSTDFPTTSGAFQTANNAAAAKAGNAFLAKFALANEANQTSYPNVLIGVPTSITINSAADYCEPDSCVLIAYVTLSSKPPGPTPTGTIAGYLGASSCSNCASGSASVSGTWSGVSNEIEVIVVTQSGYCGSNGTVSFEADYSGDSVYQASTATDDNVPLYVDCDYVKRGSPKAVPKPAIANSTGLSSSTPKTPGPKFAPLPLPQQDGSGLRARPSLAAHAEATRLSTHAVDVYFLNAMRLYGSENPQFSYNLSGLPSGFEIAVTPFSTATLTSPVGTYPISATVSAPPYDLIHVFDATLQVNKAPLTVVPHDAYQLAGIAPAAFSYELTGFRNNDTASVVSGKPILKSTAGNAPHAGNYPITVVTSALSAENYHFLTETGKLDVFAPIDIGSDLTNSYLLYSFAIGPGAAQYDRRHKCADARGNSNRLSILV